MSNPDCVTLIRSRPSEYVPGWNERGALVVLEELIALSAIEVVDQRAAGAISIELLGPLRALVRDPGRGMNFGPEPGQPISHAEYALTHIYPIPVASERLAAALTGWLWGARGSLGPVVANALCSSYTVQGRLDGQAVRQSFRSGRPEGPPTRCDSRCSGTRIELEVDASLLGDRPRLHLTRLQARVDELIESVPDLAVCSSGPTWGRGGHDEGMLALLDG